MLRRIVAPAVALVAVLGVAGCASIGSGQTSSPSAAPPRPNCSAEATTNSGTPAVAAGASAIIVHTTCRVIATGPDNITLTVLLRVPAPSARAALDGAVGTTNTVLAALKNDGVAPTDIHDGALQDAPVISPILTSVTGVGGTRITGFEASKSITATLRNLPAANGIISSVVDATGGSGQVNVTNSIDNPAQIAQARTSAVQQAHDKAEQLANAAGVSLGQLMSITDVPQSLPHPQLSSGQSQDGASSDAASVIDDHPQEVSVVVAYSVG